jgi:hypothetical protein
MKPRLLALLLAVSSAAYGADQEFDRIVKAIENHYGIKPAHIPFMGAAGFFVKVVRPAGTSGFKLAVFEDLQASTGYRDQLELDRFMEGIASGGLHRLVVTHSRRDGEASYILAGEIGKSTRMLIATFDRYEATVVEVRVDISTLLKTLGSPDEARRIYRPEQ